MTDLIIGAALVVISYALFSPKPSYTNSPFRDYDYDDELAGLDDRQN